MQQLAQHLAGIDPWIALGVAAATALTDAVCVLYTSSVVHRRDLAAANWGALTYMLSAFAVISFASNWSYVVFAALGAWVGGYATMKYLRWRAARSKGAAPPAVCAVVEHATARPLPPQQRVAA